VKKTVGRGDELVLESVLGEGSYGKVFKATWRGTVVAVKIMVLPSRMTGKEKREKMAVMVGGLASILLCTGLIVGWLCPRHVAHRQLQIRHTRAYQSLYNCVSGVLPGQLQ
jgi:hypothetical protein